MQYFDYELKKMWHTMVTIILLARRIEETTHVGTDAFVRPADRGYRAVAQRPNADVLCKASSQQQSPFVLEDPLQTVGVQRHTIVLTRMVSNGVQ